MTDEQVGQMMKEIGILQGLVAGIGTRLDTANGRTSKLEGKVELIETQQARADGRLTAYGWIFGGLIAVIGVVSPFAVWALQAFVR